MAVDISQYVAQFGDRGTGNPGAGIGYGLQAQQMRNRNRMAEQQRQDVMQERNRMAQAQQQEEQRDFTRQGIEAILSAETPEQEQAMFQGWRNEGFRRRYDMDGIPDQLTEDFKYHLAGKAGVELPGAPGGGEGRTGVQDISLKDFTPESVQKWRESGRYSDLERYESQRSTNIGGVPHRFDPATGGWYPAEVNPGGGVSGAAPQSGAGGGAPGGAPQPDSGDRPRQITAEDVAKNEATRTAAVTKAQQEARKQAELENPKAVQMRETGARLVQELLSPEMIESTKKLFGPYQGTDFARSMTFDSDVLNAKAKLEQLRDIATAENMGIMSGVLSESDLKIIGNLAGGGLVGRQSDDQAVTNLERLGQVLGGGAPQSGSEQDQSSAQEYPDGTVIRNPQTGERLIMRGGQWAPAGG